jgi:hypothetical protein
LPIKIRTEFVDLEEPPKADDELLDVDSDG